MQVSPALKRLHSVRKLEEHQRQLELTAAKAELDRLRSMLERAHRRLRMARSLVSASITGGALEDRLTAIEETTVLEKLAKLLVEKINAADQRLAQARAQFLSKRIERRQVETLLHAAQTEVDNDQRRKSQLALDEWHRFRQSAARHRSGSE